MYHCKTAVQCNNSSTTAVQYTTYYYYIAAVFAVCTSVARPPSLARRFFVGYTRLYTVAVAGTTNTVPLTWLLCVLMLRSVLRCTYDIDIPLPGCITRYFLTRPPSIARRPGLIGCTQQSVHSSTFSLVLVIAPVPPGATR